MDTYTPINFTYYDPQNSFFKAGKSDREHVNLYLCKNYDNCEAYKKNLCVMANMKLFGNYPCPQGKIQYIEGYTKQASKCGDLIRKHKERYPDLQYKLKELNHVEKCGEYIFLNFPDWFNLQHYSSYDFKKDSDEVKAYQFSFSEYFKSKIVDGYFVKVEDFTLELMNRLLDFRPCEFWGGVIKDYRNKYLPKFLYDLKKYFPDKYMELANNRPEVDDMVAEITFVGKRAKLSTLNSGKVKFGSAIVEWNKEENRIYGDQTLLSSIFVKKAKVIIEPENDVFVEILSDDSVNDLTEFA